MVSRTTKTTNPSRISLQTLSVIIVEMDKPVLTAVFVCLIAVNFTGRHGVGGIEGDTSLNDLLQDPVKNGLGKLPNDLTNGLNGNAPAAMDDAQRVLKEKCQKNSQLNNSYELVMEAQDNLQYCVRSLIDVSVFKQEIKKAEPNGDIDTVFNKYCKKSPELKKCVVNYTSTLNTCLDEDEKNSTSMIQNVVEGLVEFICHDEGDRIAMFYAEGGSDCLMDKKEAIFNCFNTSFGKYQSHVGTNVTNLPSFKFEEGQCISLQRLQQCIVNELLKCKHPTPGNIVDALFEFVRRSTPCSKFNNSSDASKAKPSLLSMISDSALGKWFQKITG